MGVRCLITDGKNYELNKLFVEDMLKYFPDYNFSIMKATISGWQSSQLKDDEDRLPTIEELIEYLLDSAKKERNDNLLNIVNKANDILTNSFNKEYQEILAKAPRDKEGRLLAPNDNPSNLTERQYALVRTKAFKKWFGDWEKSSILVNSFKQFKEKYNGKEYEQTDEFRRIQEESRRMLPSEVSKFHKGILSENTCNHLKEKLGRIYGRLLSRNADSGVGCWSLKATLKGKDNEFKIGEVAPSLFHDIFEINRNYLENGELVDLHDDYSECKCFISDDGLCGFAIEPEGNLISVFSLNPSYKGGFLYAIKDFIREEGATHLDAYASNKQNLEKIYAKTLGFYVASEMDYNMEYDHDDIAKNHDNPKVVFMVNHPVEKRLFDKNSYDEASNYAKSNTQAQFNNVSKVVDENGEPLVVYHTVNGDVVLQGKADFTIFDPNAESDKVINNQPDKITDGTNYYTQDDINYLHSRNLTINQIFTGDNIKKVLESFKNNIRKTIDRYSSENHFDLGVATLRRQKLEGNLSDKDSYYNFIQQLQDTIIDKLQKSGKTIEIKPDNNFTAAMGVKVNGNTVSLIYNPRLLLMDNERLDYILAHELVHAVTSNSINNVTLNVATETEQLFYNDIWDIIVDLNDNKNFYWDFGYNVFNTALRGSHIKEFIANVMTNPELLKHLAQIKTDKKLSLWSKFINAIKNLFNKYLGTDINNSYLEKLVNTISLHIEKSSLQNHKNGEFDTITEGNITTQQLNSTQELDAEKAKATRDFLNPVIRRQTVLKLGRMFSNIVSREYDNFKLALDNRIANEEDTKTLLELLFQRRKLSRYEVIKTLRPTTIFNRLKDTFQKYVNLTEELGIALEKQLLNKNSAFQKMSDTVKTNIAKTRFGKKKKQYQTILDNFKILAVEASKGFALTEGVSLIFSDDSVVQTLEQDTFDEEGKSDISDNKEEKKSNDGWMIDVRTVSSFSSLTNRIRQAINNIARVNKNGVQEIDDTGDTIYLSGSLVHSELIKTLAPVITEPNDMIPILLKLAVRKPWVNQVISKLQDDPLLFTEMYRAYNKSTLNYWILKPKTLNDGSIKTQTISINKMEGMDELFDSWRDNYEYGNKLDNDAVYNSNGEIIKENVKKGLDLINEVRQAIYYVRQDTRETRIATVLNKDNVMKITKAFKMVGLGLEEETIADAILYNIEDTRYEPDFNANTLVNALFTMYDDLMKNKDIKNGEQADLANLYGRALESIAKIISFVTESTMESQVRHNKKSLYAHVNSGYMINLIKKLKNPDKFKQFIEKEYMPVDWFYDKKNGLWRNLLIKNLYNNQEDRDKLSHIVMLDYNGKEYADWDTLDSTLVLFNQFRSLPTNDDHGWAYYNIPALSDTESAEFLRMRRYIKDFRSIINNKLVNLVLQEIDRIDLVKRRSQDPNVEKITNFDMVKTVDKNGVEHIKKGGAEFKFFPELNFLEINGKSFLDAYYDNASKMSNQLLNEWIAKQVDNILASRFKKALTKWEQIGLFDRVDDNPNGRFKYFETNSRDTAVALLGEWYWNSTFALSLIIELLTTDLAYYKTKGNDFLTDFIKRAKEFHAPIERLNTEAEWIVNGVRIKVCYDANGNLMKNRVLYLKDCEVPSLTLEDLKEALDKNPNLTLAEKNIIIGAYKNINVADALAYRTLDSFRRTLIMAGMWSDAEETSYNNIKNGNFRLEDITTLWNTRKPYLYTLTNQSNQVDEGNIRIPTQHKNSEMVMLTLAVLGTIMSTGKLAALERFMTKNNIDVVMFESAVKVGGQDIINLNNIDASEVEEYLTEYVNQHSLAIHEFDYDDYGIQTATPEHGIDAMLLVGTQIRRIIASNQDMTDPNFRFKYGNKEWTVLEWLDYYNMVNTANIRESFMNLDKKFSNIKQIEKLLLSEVRSNPRYDSDIELALTLNDKGVFNIPLLDPSITYKILSLLTSIVKSRVTKLKIAGGAYIQTSAWGFKREPKVVYNNDGSVKHIECYLPCPSEELYNMLIDENTGEVDINKKYKGTDGKEYYIVPEKYREFIGYRVPTESFYSCAPFKVIGFLPRQVGTIIVVPRDIVSMAGSDFDVDKVYTMLHTLNFKKQYNIKQAWSDFYKSHPEITKEIDENYNKLFLDFLTTWNEDNEKLDLEDLKDARDDFKEWLKTNNIKKSLFSETALDEFNKWFKENKLNYLLNIIPLVNEYKDINKEDIQGDKPTKRELLDNMLNNNNKEQRDSLLIDLMWAVLTNKETTPKLMKSGGFDGPKKAARIATILKNNTIQSLKDKGYDIDTLISDLNKKSVGELTDIVDKMSEVLNPLTPDTWVTLHDRNMAGAALIPIAATNNAGHALMQHTLLLFKKPITLNGKKYYSLHDIKNTEGKYITENIAEFLAAVVDNAKDPIAGDMNLNTYTAGIAFMLLRMGVNATTTALLLSLPIVYQAVELSSKKRISLSEAFNELVNTMTSDLKAKGKSVPEINVDKLNFTDNWLALAILGYNNMSFSSLIASEKDALLYLISVGKLFAERLCKMALDLTDFTLATRADTLNGGAGPTISDTQINIERYTTIKEDKTSLLNWKILISKSFEETKYFSTDDIIESETPILQAFFTYGLESVEKLFNKILPYYNDTYLMMIDLFRNNTRNEKLSVDTRNKIYTLYINYLLSKEVDKRFENSDEQRDYFINRFPIEFEKIVNNNPILKKYDFINRIVKLNPTVYNPAPALKFNNVGRISDIQKMQYMLDWESLLYINNETKQLAYDLLTYNMYRGLDFSPSGFGHLVPSIVKMTHPYYIKVLNSTLNNSTADPNDLITFYHQFIRNNLHIRELVPDCSNAIFSDEYDTINGNRIGIELTEFSSLDDRKVAKSYSKMDLAKGTLEFMPYIMRKIDGKEHYYELVDDSFVGYAEYKEILPLGKRNKYYEYNGLESDIESVIKSSKDDSILDNTTDNDNFNPQDNQSSQGYGSQMVDMIKLGLLNLTGHPTTLDNNLDKLNSIDSLAIDPQTNKPICGSILSL